MIILTKSIKSKQLQTMILVNVLLSKCTNILTQYLQKSGRSVTLYDGTTLFYQTTPLRVQHILLQCCIKSRHTYKSRQNNIYEAYYDLHY